MPESNDVLLRHELKDTFKSLSRELESLLTALSSPSLSRDDLVSVRERYGVIKDRVDEALSEARRSVRSEQGPRAAFSSRWTEPAFHQVACDLNAKRTARGPDILNSTYKASSTLGWWLHELEGG